MKGWPSIALAEACTKIQDGAHRSPQTLHAQPGPGRFPYLTSKNIRTGYLKLDTVQYCESEFHDEIYARCNPEFGDVLLTKDGANTGNATINTLHEPFSLLSSVCLLKPDPSRLLSRFLFYYIQSGRGFAQITGQMTGAAIKRIILKTIKNCQIPLPPLPVQERIVAILDEAIAAIATATANAEKSLANARELYRSILRVCFDQSALAPSATTAVDTLTSSTFPNRPSQNSAADSRTRGRQATTSVIPGDLSLSVGMPAIAARPNWRWSELASIARLESGHTPSKRHPEYWDGGVPWIGIRDARTNHGTLIQETESCTNELGLANSSARLLPAGTVCLSRTASVGYVVVMGREMATSQDFVNWVCSTELEPDFLKYLFIAEGKGLLRYASGSVHQTIYFPEVKSFHVCHPDPNTQRQIIDFLDVATGQVQELERIGGTKIVLLTELKQSLLHKAFTGELTADKNAAARTPSEAGL